MSVAGLCEICQTGTVEHTCDRCGNLVCDQHLDRTTGRCTECVADTSGRPGQGEGTSRPADSNYWS